MIHLPDASLIISGPSGILQSFDSEGLRATLFQAFSSQGIHEDWIIDHFLLSIEEKIRLTNDQGIVHLSEQDIHGFVDTLLTASGYSDVAREYIRLCGLDPFAEGYNSYNLTADDVLLICCPPAPDALKTSILISAGFISISTSSTTGRTATVAVDV